MKNQIMIKQEMRIPGTDVILEPGDKIVVVKEAFALDYVGASEQLLRKFGLGEDYEPLEKSDERRFLVWLNTVFEINANLGFRSSKMWLTNKQRANSFWEQVLMIVGEEEAYEVVLSSFLDFGTQWEARKSYMITTISR